MRGRTIIRLPLEPEEPWLKGHRNLAARKWSYRWRGLRRFCRSLQQKKIDYEVAYLHEPGQWFMGLLNQQTNPYGTMGTPEPCDFWAVITYQKGETQNG